MAHALMTGAALLALPFLILTIAREFAEAFREAFGA